MLATFLLSQVLYFVSVKNIQICTQYYKFNQKWAVQRVQATKHQELILSTKQYYKFILTHSQRDVSTQGHYFIFLCSTVFMTLSFSSIQLLKRQSVLFLCLGIKKIESEYCKLIVTSLPRALTQPFYFILIVLGCIIFYFC